MPRALDNAPIEPFGLDLSPAVADLARRRLPHWADRIFVGNALTWQPPRRFDFVRTELVYVPAQRQPAFIRRLLDDVVAPEGRLIVCGYGSPRSNVPTHPVRELVRTYGFAPELELEADAPEGGGPIHRACCSASGDRAAGTQRVQAVVRQAPELGCRQPLKKSA